MNGKWRLINGKELYNLADDPEQRRDLAEAYPEEVGKLRNDYEKWWKDISPVFTEYPAIIIGTEREKITVLSSHDLHSGGPVAWNHQQVRSGLISNGWWALRAASGGTYDTPIRSGLEAAPAIAGTSVTRSLDGKALPITNARIKIGDFDQIRPVKDSDTEITFKVTLAPGDTRLQTWFTGKNDLSLCAYYVYIEKD